jgi:hypothetical protein
VITQMESADREIARREANGKHLTSKLREIPGIVPRKEYPETTRLGYHTCGFRYKAQQFDGLSRDQFLKAVTAEGIPIGKSLGNIDQLPQNREGSIEGALTSKTFKGSTCQRTTRRSYYGALTGEVSRQEIGPVVQRTESWFRSSANVRRQNWRGKVGGNSDGGLVLGGDASVGLVSRRGAKAQRGRGRGRSCLACVNAGSRRGCVGWCVSRALLG